MCYTQMFISFTLLNNSALQGTELDQNIDLLCQFSDGCVNSYSAWFQFPQIYNAE